jgi:hypothetical protein
VTAALAIRLDMAGARVAAAVRSGDALALLAAALQLHEVVEETGRIAAPDARLRGAAALALARLERAGERLAAELAAQTEGRHRDSRLRGAYRGAV